MPGPMQRPMPGFNRAMQQQPMPQRPGAPMAPGMPAASGPPQNPAWGQTGQGWLPRQLQGLGRQLGAQAGPPVGAPEIQNPGAMRPGGPDRGAPQQVSGGAQQYAQNATRQLINEEDPRLMGR